ncbi:hypothetical protein [Actinoallomurus sp. CA-142502]|uniref:hypothetical protein n=1 Tax=Actinoallomurus sp. CA-142502 TaxID=3239885 RepID=UPI003D91AF0C
MGKTNRPDTLLSEIAELKRRVAQLETQQRLSSARISSGQLTVGAVDAPDQIEISATERHIRFENADGPACTLTSYGAGGAVLESSSDAGTTFSFGTRALVWDGPYFTNLQVSRVDGDTSTVQAEVYADVQDSGGGNSRGTVSLRAVGDGDANGSIIDISADGGIIFDSNNRTTDPPAPPIGSITLYVKGSPSRLYYRDPGGTVHGPL